MRIVYKVRILVVEDLNKLDQNKKDLELVQQQVAGQKALFKIASDSLKFTYGALRKIDENSDLMRANIAKIADVWRDSCRHLEIIIEEMNKEKPCKP